MSFAVLMAQLTNRMILSSSKLKSIPPTTEPTTEAFTEHAYRSHHDYDMEIFTLVLANSANPLGYGWTRKEDNKLFPIILPDDVSGGHQH